MSISFVSNFYKKFTEFVSRKYLTASNIDGELPSPENNQFLVYFRNNKLVFKNSLGSEVEVGDKISESHAIGIVFLYKGIDIPMGYLKCDGSKYDTTKYFELFSVINTDVLPSIQTNEGLYIIKAKNSKTNGTQVFVGKGLEHDYNRVNDSLHIYSLNKYNYLINGDFKINQRGESFKNVNDKFVSDRFKLDYSSEKSSLFLNNVEIKKFSPNELLDDNLNSKNYIRISQTKVDSNKTYLYFNQKIENVENLSGQTATFSFFGKCDTIKSIGIRLIQNFGEGGSKETVNQISNIIINKNWERKVVSLKIPSITGKVIGVDSYLQIGLLLPVSEIFDLNLAYFQLEIGSFSSYINRSYQEELALCQRYYEIQTIETLSDISVFKNVKNFNTQKRVFPKISLIEGNFNLSRFGKVYDSTNEKLNLGCYCQLNPARESGIITLGFDSEF